MFSTDAMEARKLTGKALAEWLGQAERFGGPLPALPPALGAESELEHFRRLCEAFEERVERMIGRAL